MLFVSDAMINLYKKYGDLLAFQTKSNIINGAYHDNREY
jgi:hypothetical protein